MVCKYFYRNEFRNYVFQSNTGPSGACAQGHIHPTVHILYLSLMSTRDSPSTLPEDLGTTSVSENIQVHTYRLIVLYLALLSLVISSAFESLSYAWSEWKVWRKSFQERYFDVACHRSRSHQYPNLSWITLYTRAT